MINNDDQWKINNDERSTSTKINDHHHSHISGDQQQWKINDQKQCKINLEDRQQWKIVDLEERYKISSVDHHHSG